MGTTWEEGLAPRTRGSPGTLLVAAVAALVLLAGALAAGALPPRPDAVPLRWHGDHAA